MMRRALVTGATGQDGSYMCELLLEKGYEVYGLVRRSSIQHMPRLQHIEDAIRLISGDMTDSPSIERAIQLARPHEVYNFAAQSHVGTSYVEPIHTGDVTGLGAMRLFEALRMYAPDARIYQASSSEQYGNQPAPQSEVTPFAPVSPYACAKTFAHYAAQVYRGYGMHISCGIGFNHESPRRGESFVTRMLSLGAARIKLGLQQTIPFYLPTPLPKRDWMHAKDLVEGAWLLLQHHSPRDVVFGSGEGHTVLEAAQLIFGHLGLTFEDHLQPTPALKRPVDVYDLQADARVARDLLGWKPRVTFCELMVEMVEADVDTLARTLHPRAGTDAP